MIRSTPRYNGRDYGYFLGIKFKRFEVEYVPDQVSLLFKSFDFDFNLGFVFNLTFFLMELLNISF